MKISDPAIQAALIAWLVGASAIYLLQFHSLLNSFVKLLIGENIGKKVLAVPMYSVVLSKSPCDWIVEQSIVVQTNMLNRSCIQ